MDEFKSRYWISEVKILSNNQIYVDLMSYMYFKDFSGSKIFSSLEEALLETTRDKVDLHYD